MPIARQKILLAQLNSNGDCLFATVIARQIKEIDYPGCHLTWAVNDRCKQSVFLNPYVDEIWELKTEKTLTSDKEWCGFVKDAEKKKANGDFDVIFYTQIIGDNFIRLNGDIRASIYKNYPYPIIVSQQPVIHLSEKEIENVRSFADKNDLKKYREVILVECGPESFNSVLNPSSATAFATEFISQFPDIAFVLSSAKKIESSAVQIIDGSVLSFRENAELTKYCSFFIGCSSGISWLTTANIAKPLQKILIINPNTPLNSSMVHDHETAGLPASHIIELNENPMVLQELKDCLMKVLQENFQQAKKLYHQPFKRKNFKYIYYVAKASFKKWNFIFPFEVFKKSIRRDGFSFNAFFHLLKLYIKLPFFIIRNLFAAKKC